MQAKRDQNRVTTLLAVSNVDGETPVTLYADPDTHALLTDATTVPASPDMSVQFNDGGVFGGDSYFRWDKTSKFLLLGVEGDEGTIKSPDATTNNTEGTYLTIRAGFGLGTENGGGIEIVTGEGGSTGGGGDLDLQGGEGGLTSGFGGSISLTAGSAQAGDSAGGQVNISGGEGFGAESGGDIGITAGDGGSTGNGGNISLTSGNGGTDSSGGSFSIFAGNGGSGDSPGGDIVLSSGYASGSGNNGTLRLITPIDNGVSIENDNVSFKAIFDVSNLDSADRTFTFPDATGTFALQTAASGSFTTADAKTVTVVNGIITSIV